MAIPFTLDPTRYAEPLFSVLREVMGCCTTILESGTVAFLWVDKLGGHAEAEADAACEQVG